MSTMQDLHVPHLMTALTGLPSQLENHLLQNQVAIETWLRQQWRKNTAPFYCSVDIRNAGFKMSTVDTNLFPGGFNNLSKDFLPLCIQAVQTTLEHMSPDCLRLILIPENHTRNLFYLENIATLQTILIKAGFDVRIGSLREDLSAPENIQLPSGSTVCLEPLLRENNRVKLADFSACVVLLNNDLASGIPTMLHDLEQPIIPALELGWHARLKSNHFFHYQQVCNEFAELIGIDPWLLNPLFKPCENINFLKRESEELLVSLIDAMLAEIQEKYDFYGIEAQPFVVVKSDSGTYGMGVMTVCSGNEIRQLNRKERTRMSASKGQQDIDKFLIQEGIHTFETIGENNAVAEPVVYMLGQYVVGGFYRVHTRKGNNENLNAPGMYFEPLAFAQPCNNPAPEKEFAHPENRFYCYGVIARLALVAAAREIAEVKSKLTKNS